MDGAFEQAGRRIYYLKATGVFIYDTGEYAGYAYIAPGLDRDHSEQPVLQQYNKNEIGHIDLGYGEYREEFGTCFSFRVNPETKQLEFAHRDETSFESPLTEQIAELKQEQLTDKQRIADLELMLAEILTL